MTKTQEFTKTKYDQAVVQALAERWHAGSQPKTPFNQGTLGAWFLRFFRQRPWFIQFQYAAQIYGETEGMPEQVLAWHAGMVTPITDDCRACPFQAPNGACRICNHGKS